MTRTIELTDEHMEALNKGGSITIQGKEPEPEIDWNSMIGRLIMVRDYDDREWYGPVELVGINGSLFKTTVYDWKQAKPYAGPTRPNWIEWSGGECPVYGGALVLTEWKNGRHDSGLARLLDWVKRDRGNDIVRYTVIKP